MTRKPPILGSAAAFAPALNGGQETHGTRLGYAVVVDEGGFYTKVDDRLTRFLSQVNSFYLASASANGLPYIQHRGGPRGFLRILDDQTLGFAYHSGDRQDVNLENLKENNRVCLLLMDYAMKRQVEIWGRARVERDPALLEKLKLGGDQPRPDQAIVIVIEAWNGSSSPNIPHLVPRGESENPAQSLQARLATLEVEPGHPSAQKPSVGEQPSSPQP